MESWFLIITCIYYWVNVAVNFFFFLMMKLFYIISAGRVSIFAFIKPLFLGLKIYAVDIVVFLIFCFPQEYFNENRDVISCS